MVDGLNKILNEFYKSEINVERQRKIEYTVSRIKSLLLSVAMKNLKEKKMSEEELKRAEEEKARQVDSSLILGGIHSLSGCIHCYCGNGVWNDKKHLVCCICGHRTVAPRFSNSINE